MATVSIILMTKKTNKQGLTPIYFRVTKNRKSKYISTEIRIEEKHWDYTNKRVSTKHPNSKRFNSMIANQIAELQDLVFEYESQNKSVSVNQLKTHIHGQQPVSFIEYAEVVLRDYKTNEQYTSYDKNRSVLTKLKTYLKGRNPSFQDVNVRFLKDYEYYLVTELENKVNTVGKDFKFIRKVFNDAYKEDIIEYNINPFTKYKIKSKAVNKVFLTEEEVLSIANLNLEKGSKLELHRDMFVFACYCAGPRVSDVLKLKNENFDGQFITFVTRKTNVQQHIKVPTTALAILKKYTSNQSNAFIFPSIDSDKYDLKDPIELDRAISNSNAQINKRLKVIAKKAEIDKNISFHTSRHTFATLALTKDISIDKVSKLLGHKDLRETQIYAKIVDKSLDQAMDVFNF